MLQEFHGLPPFPETKFKFAMELMFGWCNKSHYVPPELDKDDCQRIQQIMFMLRDKWADGKTWMRFEETVVEVYKKNLAECRRRNLNDYVRELEEDMRVDSAGNPEGLIVEFDKIRKNFFYLI